MNGIFKSIAVVAIISFCLSACGGESSGESTGSMTGGSGGGSANLSQLSAEAKRGYAIYNGAEQACSSCHGAQGQGTPSAAPVPINSTATCANCADLATLTGYNTFAMPKAPYSPSACVGTCASDVSSFIIEGFIEGKLTYDDNSNPPPAIPAINVNPVSGLTTTEAGGTATFTVALNTLPTDNVDITLMSDNALEGNVNPTALTFTIANWNQLQTVTVTGVDDANLDGNMEYTIITTAASNDVDYAAIDPDDVMVVNNDDEVPPPGVITVDPTSGLVTSENGDAATFTIVLGTVPSQDVSIGLSSSNAAEGTVMPASVAFNAGNYNVPQTVTVTGVNDVAAPMVDGNIAYSAVTAAAISNDPAYSGLDASDVMVINNDNDVQPVIAQFTADPVSNAGSPIAYGGMVTLNWTTDGDNCTAGGANANGQWTGALLATGMQTLTNLTTSGVNTFAITCSKGGINSDVSTVDVTVAAQPGAPTVNLAADPTMLAAPGDSTITWSTTDATSCVASSNPANVAWDNNAKPLQGTQIINNLSAASNTFSLACTNAGGLVTQSDTIVTVQQPNPTLTFTVNNAPSATVNQGDSVALAWNPNDLQSCTASANPANAAWTGAKGVAQATYSETIANLQASTTFTLNCTGLNGANVTESVTTTVNAGDPELSLGKSEYEKIVNGQSCATCHGVAGEGGLDDSVIPYLDVNDLAQTTGYVQFGMPTFVDYGGGVMGGGTPADCDNTCATAVAKYMKNGFSIFPAP